MSHLSIGEAYCFRGLPLSCTGQSGSGGPPWGHQTAWGHSGYERYIWLNDRAGLSLPVSMSFDKAAALTMSVFFHFTAESAALALSDFESCLYLFAFVKELSREAVGVSCLHLQ